MKRSMLIVGVILFMGFVLLAGNATAKRITIRMGHDLPPFTTPGMAYDQFAKEVNQKCDGRIKVEVYPAGSLSDQTNGLEMINSGIADAYHISLSSHRTMFPNANVHALPGHSFPDTVQGHQAHTAAIMSLIDRYDAVAEEFDKYNILFNCINASTLFASTSKAIHVPDDLKGLKVGGTGARLEFTKLCGGAGIFNVIPEAYQSLQTGVIDVTTIHWIALGEFKVFEVCSHVLDMPIDQTSLMCLMKKSKWDQIPTADQNIIREAAANAQTLNYRLNEERTISGRDKFQSYGKGRTIISPTAEERRLWEDKFQVVRNQWIADRQAVGVDNAQAILEYHKQLVDQAWNR